MASSVIVTMFWTIGILAEVSLGYLRLEPPGTLHAFFTGDSFFVTCFAGEGSGATRLTWQGPMRRDITVSHGRVHVEPSPHSPFGLELVLEDVKYKDQGMYTCSAVIDGSEVRTPFSLIVYQSITFEGTPKEQYGAENSDFLLLCNVRSDPTAIVSWYVNGSLVSNGPRHCVTEDGLYIKKLKRTDSGNYTCQAFVVTPHSSQMKDMHIWLDVHYRPVWHKPHMETAYGLVGGTARLVCEAHSQPTPDFEWFRERALLGNSRTYKIHNSKWKSILQVKIHDHTAFGNYLCVASNALGEVSRYVSVFEGVYPRKPNLTLDTDEPGSLVVKLCQHPLDTLPVLGYRVQYRMQAESWSKSKENYVYKDNTMILQDLAFEEVYVVRAKARNAVGYSNYSDEVSLRTKGPIAETVLDNPGVSSLSNTVKSSSSSFSTSPGFIPQCSLTCIALLVSLCLPLKRNRRP